MPSFLLNVNLHNRANSNNFEEIEKLPKGYLKAYERTNEVVYNAAEQMGIWHIYGKEKRGRPKGKRRQGAKMERR